MKNEHDRKYGVNYLLIKLKNMNYWNKENGRSLDLLDLLPLADCVCVLARKWEHKTALLIKINDGQSSRRTRCMILKTYPILLLTFFKAGITESCAASGRKVEHLCNRLHVMQLAKGIDNEQTFYVRKIISFIWQRYQIFHWLWDYKIYECVCAPFIVGHSMWFRPLGRLFHSDPIRGQSVWSKTSTQYIIGVLHTHKKHIFQHPSQNKHGTVNSIQMQLHKRIRWITLRRTRNPLKW